ncbi:MAG: gamma-glutamyltransferase [Gammaproteobacteria bacterium]|nr:gamma-glutamyltransferase [Gammaproteobacteria bacterium]
MSLIAEPVSSTVRPVLRGRLGAVSAAHPLAAAAGQEMLLAGGTAADAAIAAQAVLCVVMPDACSLGGDMLALAHMPGSAPLAINGTGAAPLRLERVSDDGANSITVPGIVDAWCVLSKLQGRLPLSRVLEPAIRLASSGMRVSQTLSAGLASHRARLQRGGADGWSLFDRHAGELIQQTQLAEALRRIGTDGRDAFFAGGAARGIARAVQALGGTLSEADLAAHKTIVASPVESGWGNLRLAMQPPMSQGVLLNMAVGAMSRLGEFPTELLDHVAIELTDAAFAFRADVGKGAALLAHELPVDLQKASHRGGPRAYLHTAGVAAADAEGRLISSLVSVFDEFGSCVYVPELGFTLNNRAGGFTDGANAAAPGKRPVHTLAPALVTTSQGVLALATPGADGQVQTLLQVLIAIHREQLDLARAIARPRWRSENGALLIEQSHTGIAGLAARGHRVTPIADGDARFGAVVCAGWIDDQPVAGADWRRETTAGVV